MTGCPVANRSRQLQRRVELLAKRTHPPCTCCASLCPAVLNLLRGSHRTRALPGWHRSPRRPLVGLPARVCLSLECSGVCLEHPALRVAVLLRLPRLLLLRLLLLLLPLLLLRLPRVL